MIGVMRYADYDPKKSYPYDLVVAPLSRSRMWKGLSPFFLGPVTLPRVPGEKERATFLNLENAWQYSKVYPKLGHLVDNSEEAALSDAYLDWRAHGSQARADRYPAGKGAVPAFSVYGNLRLSYVAARKLIYVPQYARLVMLTDEYSMLAAQCAKGKSLLLLEFDAHPDQNSMSFNDIVNNVRLKMGHSYVLRECLRRPRDPEWYKRILV